MNVEYVLLEEENDIKYNRESFANGTETVASYKTVTASNKKCGEIFVHVNDPTIFSFLCVFCNDAKFTEISDFFEHFKTIHTKSLIFTTKVDPLGASSDDDAIKVEPDEGAVETALVEPKIDSTIKCESDETRCSTDNNKGNCKNQKTQNNNDEELSSSDKNYSSNKSNRKTRKHLEKRPSKKNSYSKSHNCEYCRHKFKTVSSLNRHKKNFHSAESNLSTNIRQTISKVNKDNNTNDNSDSDSLKKSHMKNLKIVMKERSWTYKSHTCKFCGEKFSGRSSLSRHRLNVHKISIKQNPEYEKIAKNETSLDEVNDESIMSNENSLKVVMKERSSTYKSHTCEFCGDKFSGRSSLSRHRLKIHKISIKSNTDYLSCKSEEEIDDNSIVEIDSASNKYDNESIDDDNETGNTNTEIDDENDVSPSSLFEEKNDPLTCQYCGRKFKCKTYRMDHERSHTGDKTFKCSFCNKAFLFKRTLTSHEMIHQGIKPHKCTICSSAFTLKANLRQHMQRRHLSEKKISCKYCGKLFLQNYERTVHERIHTGEKPYMCSVCGKCFSTVSRLNTHNVMHTNNRRYKCEFCEKSFLRKPDLDDHRRGHTGERPFKCEICQATFPRKKALREHKKIHSDVAQHHCNICGKPFKQKSGLNYHIKSHGRIP